MAATKYRFGWTVYRPGTDEVFARDLDRDKIDIPTLHQIGLAALMDWEFDEGAIAEACAEEMKGWKLLHGVN